MRRRILLADDSVTIQKVIELTFMDEDYDVKAVSNGDEALAALPEVKPDVVIADVHMPGANGYEVCRRSKEIQADVPVLLLVGTFEPFDEGQARAAGADSFLKKPFDSQELLQRVQDLIASRPGAAAAAPVPPPLPTFAETDLGAALPPLDLGSFEPPAAFDPAPAETDWGAFQLEPEPAAAFAAPEPRLDSPFLEEEASPFVLEDDRETAVLPAGEPMFELDSPEPHASASDTPAADTPPPFPHQPAGFAAPWEEERIGVPESAVPLVDSLAETEARIETGIETGPPFAAAHEPESAAAWSAPAELEPLPWNPEPLPWSPEPEPAPWSPPPAAAEEAPLFVPLPMPVSEPPAAEPLVSEPPAAEPLAAEPAPVAAPAAVPEAVHAGNGRLSDEDVDRIARRVVELIGDKAVRDIAWEVIPDLAEVVIRGRLRELEAQVENPAE
jgi:CheY-like chemotaxis protein